MSRRRFTTQEALDLVRRFGTTVAAAEILGVTPYSISRRLNAEAPGWKSPTAVRRGHRYTMAERSHAVRLYAKGTPILDICATTGISERYVHKLARESGLQRRGTR